MGKETPLRSLLPREDRIMIDDPAEHVGTSAEVENGDRS